MNLISLSTLLGLFYKKIRKGYILTEEFKYYFIREYIEKNLSEEIGFRLEVSRVSQIIGWPY